MAHQQAQSLAIGKQQAPLKTDQAWGRMTWTVGGRGGRGGEGAFCCMGVGPASLLIKW
ncbi:predicted protein [Plenodomus lingam JN3]|uniref:Predicted protein n=1 Tax=Leptosphaeria maculans (strain JN3 / isolate v23.1.3 / race Av1-4-5-6-7-8) TaxID=985895 RepID=E4ZNK2_LEPMJ|nr:predicted protein [Plenodomus lingam JN3]CBX93061.1 predicted protein [Plenodomus lingam JN3]